MPRRRGAESGQYSQVYWKQEVVDLLEGNRLGTSKVADELEGYRTTAHKLLTKMESEGLFESKPVWKTFMWTLQKD
jgi:DNA-binding IclR family transcriptional regulator